MKLPIRTSKALNEETLRILEKLKEPNVSQSDLIRRALKFYYTFRGFGEGELERLKIHAEMLTGGEHVIVDLDHLVTMLRIIESTPQKDKFWEEHRRIARSHAEQFRYLDLERILKRLEACNFFRLVKMEDEYILIFGNEEIKKFISVFLQEVFDILTLNAQMKEELTKIRIAVIK
jgi:hypothetical protein